MKKFSKIVENVDSKLIVDPKKSLKCLLEYLFEGGEDKNFFDYLRDYVDYDIKNSKEFGDDFDEGITNFDNFKKFLKKYDLEEDAQTHIYYDMMVMNDFYSKLKATSHYMKKINEN